MTSTTIQAPWVNLVTAMTTATTPVATAPTPLMTSRRRQPARARVHQCRTMPACDRVNEMKTPTA